MIYLEKYVIILVMTTYGQEKKLPFSPGVTTGAEFAEIVGTQIAEDGALIRRQAGALWSEDMQRRVDALRAQAVAREVNSVAVAAGLDMGQEQELKRRIALAGVPVEAPEAGLVRTEQDPKRAKFLKEDLWNAMSEATAEELVITSMCHQINRARLTKKSSLGDVAIGQLAEYRDRVLRVLGHEAFEDYVKGSGLEERKKERREVVKKKVGVVVAPAIVTGLTLIGSWLGGAGAESAILSVLSLAVSGIVAGVSWSEWASRFSKEFYKSYEGLSHLEKEGNLTNYVLGLREKLGIVNRLLALGGVIEPPELVGLAEKFLLACDESGLDKKNTGRTIVC